MIENGKEDDSGLSCRCRARCSGVCSGGRRDWLNATHNKGKWERVAKEQVGSVDGTILR